MKCVNFETESGWKIHFGFSMDNGNKDGDNQNCQELKNEERTVSCEQKFEKSH